MLKYLGHSLLLRCLVAITFIVSLCGATIDDSPKHSTKHSKHHVVKTTKKHKKIKKKKACKPAAIPANASIQQGLDQIINSFNSNLNVGVIVQSTTNGATLYEHNAEQAFAPGSTMKLFTAAAALAYLGPNYVFPTQFLAYGSPQRGALSGNLYVKFSGDPMLMVQDLNVMVKTLREKGVRTIQGNLIIDDLAMDRVNSAPGWNPQDQLMCFTAPTNAIILNRNCFSFNIIGGHQTNAPPRVSYSSGFDVISIINQVATRRASSAQCPFDVKSAAGNTYYATGCLAPKRSVGLAVSLTDPRRAGTNVLTGLLRQQGITVMGGVGYGRAPANVTVLAEHDSPPLRTLITRMLKKSDNLIANTLFKKLGNVYFKTAGSWTSGVQAVRAILGPRTGIDFNNMVVLDGCGLSHDNQVSATQFASLLNYTYRALPSREVFYEALPRSGIDGTLRFRLGGDTQDKVHAKTGTIENASSLAGYVQTASHQTLIFAVLVNGRGGQGTYHMLEDRICKFLAMK